MIWHLSHRFDAAAVPIADRHYNRQHPKGGLLALGIRLEKMPAAEEPHGAQSGLFAEALS